MKTENKTWHVVHTLARAEWRARDDLERRGFETLLVHYASTVRHARRERPVLRPLFPRYVFVGVEPGQGLYGVWSSWGVAEVLAGVDGPGKVAPKIIRVLQDRADRTGRVDAPRTAPPPARAFRPGEVVRIVDGPLSGFKAIVEIDKQGEVRVRLNAFGGAIPGFLPANALKSLHPQGLLSPNSARSIVT